jgi:hypothetical protein
MTALCTIDWIVCQLGNLRRQSRPPPLALGRLSYRLASGLRLGESTLASDVF